MNQALSQWGRVDDAQWFVPLPIVHQKKSVLNETLIQQNLSIRDICDEQGQSYASLDEVPERVVPVPKSKTLQKQKDPAFWMSVVFGVLALIYQGLSMASLIPAMHLQAGMIFHMVSLAVLLVPAIFHLKENIQNLSKASGKSSQIMHALSFVSIVIAWGSSLLSLLSVSLHWSFHFESHLCCLLFIFATLSLRKILEAWALKASSKAFFPRSAWVLGQCALKFLICNQNTFSVFKDLQSKWATI